MHNITDMKISFFISCCLFAFSLNATAQTEPQVEAPPPIDATAPVFQKVETEASFPGGQTSWSKYLVRNLRTDVPANNKAKPGRYTVVVQFVVSADGELSDVKALSKQGFGMEEEVIRVLTKGPKWIPAKQNGRNVKAIKKQDVTFGVSE